MPDVDSELDLFELTLEYYIAAIDYLIRGLMHIDVGSMNQALDLAH